MTKPILHHLNASRSQRLVWLLEELGIEYDIVHHQRNTETNLAPPELLKIHPMGKSPLLVDEGVVIAETGAIAQYLLAKHDPGFTLHPKPGTPDFPRFLEWVHAAEGAVFLPGLFMFYLMNSGLESSPLFEAMAGEAIKAAMTIEQHLSKHAYFAGQEFSAADCLMGFQIQNGEQRFGLDGAPATKAWLDKVRERPAYKRMLEIGI